MPSPIPDNPRQKNNRGTEVEKADARLAINTSDDPHKASCTAEYELILPEIHIEAVAAISN
jgi:hypothetical protein